jgi:hypothetical protein
MGDERAGHAMNDDWISLKNACALLKVSRPTLNKIRKEFRLKEHRIANRVLLSKIDIIKKVMLAQNHLEGSRSLLVTSSMEAGLVRPIVGVYDFRNIDAIDAYGVMSILCDIKFHLKENESNRVYLLADDGLCSSYLDSIGFFTEAARANSSRVFVNRDDIRSLPQSKDMVILPLHQIGYRGAEKKILDQLYDPLLMQGFSEEYCGYIGWIIGELCDNAHTHSQGGPCYLIIESLARDTTDIRFLTIAMGDTGIGVPTSLRSNPKYSNLSDEQLLHMAFLSEVSRMEVEPKRGKGLNDVLGIAKGNGAWLKIESNGQGLFFDFEEQEGEIVTARPLLPTPGTRFCLVLIDSSFQRISRHEINKFIQSFLDQA